MRASSLVWFRNDLRVSDHHALSAACAGDGGGAGDGGSAGGRGGGGVVGLYVISPGDWRRHDDAPVKIDLILRSLVTLSDGLRRLNVPLLVRTASRPEEVPELVERVARECKVAEAHWVVEYPVHEVARDRLTAERLRRAGVRVVEHHDQVVLPPGSVLTGDGRAFTVFTPFKRAWMKRVAEMGGVALALAPKRQPAMACPSDPIPAAVDGFASSVSADLWPAGEPEAQRRLGAFVRNRIQRYKADRDFPAIDGTSTLSPYLAIGAISTRQCVVAAAEANDGRLDAGREGPVTWISEVVWREFYRHVIAAYPRVSMGRAFKPGADRVKWADNPEHLRAWCEGRTGVPIVDAAMRQLRATGWMHNRLRMIAAMYLTKDLFLDWRLGEAHFMRHLVDGDLAQNNGGWQWSASTGTDAAPYFRIFNPVSQSRRFDPQGAFIRRWVPELAGVEADAIHDPGELPPLARARIDYPPVLVDHGRARARVLAAFRSEGAGSGSAGDVDD